MINYASLAHTRPVRHIDPFMLTVPPQDRRPPLAHAGEEFLHVVKGTVRLEYGQEVEELTAGDSAYFDGEHPHRLVCLDDQPAEVLVVYYGTDKETLHEVNGEGESHR